MAFNYWEEDDEEFTGEYVQEGGGDFPIIPHEYRVMAFIDKAEWLLEKENYKDENRKQKCISLRFEIEDGEFKGQKIFKKFFVESDNDEQVRKDYSMFLNIDANAGGRIRRLKRKPDDEELQTYLINKSMVIVIGAFTDKATKKELNYLMGVSSGNSKPSTKPETKSSEPVSGKRAAKMYIEDDDIPF